MITKNVVYFVIKKKYWSFDRKIQKVIFKYIFNVTITNDFKMMICYYSLLNDWRSTYINNYVLLTVTFHLNYMSCCDILRVICITVLNIYFEMLHLCLLFIVHWSFVLL